MTFSEFYPPLASLLALLSISASFLRINKIFPTLCSFFYSYLYLAGMLRYKGVIFGRMRSHTTLLMQIIS